MLLSFFAAKTLQSIREAQWAKGLLSNSIMRILMVYFLLFRLKMLLRFLLLATTVLLLVKTKVKANEDSQKPSKPGPPPPSFVAVVPTSIMGDFDGALFPFLIEETTTTTTTTTPAPFGTFTTFHDIAKTIQYIYVEYFSNWTKNNNRKCEGRKKWFSLWLEVNFFDRV